MLVSKRTSGNSRGGARSWLRLGVFVGIAATGPLAALCLDHVRFNEIAGDWTVTAASIPPALHFPGRFKIEPDGEIRNIGLVGSGLCGRNCYTLHLLQTGTNYRLQASADRQTLMISGTEPTLALTAGKRNGRP